MKDTENNPIGEFVKKKRKERDLTQQKLAEFADVSFSFINRIENGDTNVTLQTLNKVLNIFGFELGPIPAQRVDTSEDASEGKN